MARFQDVRGKLEITTRDALQSQGFAVVFDNLQETPPPLPYAVVSLSFGNTVEPSLGCTADHLRGSMIVTLATPKQQGSAKGEDAAQSVLQAWTNLNRDFANAVRLRTYNHDGPVTLDPGQTPRHLHTLNCGFTARVSAPIKEPWTPLSVLVDQDLQPLVTDAGDRIMVLL